MVLRAAVGKELSRPGPGQIKETGLLGPRH